MAKEMAARRPRNLELVLAPSTQGAAPEGWTRALFGDALQDLKSFRGMFGWTSVRLITQNPFALPAPAKTIAALLLLSPWRAEIVGASGAPRRPVSVWTLVSELLKHRKEKERITSAPREVVATIEAVPERSLGFKTAEGPPVFLRTNLWFGAQVGGAFSHSAGVLNALREIYGDVLLLTTDSIPSLDPRITDRRFELDKIEGWRGGPAVHFVANDELYAQAVRLAGSLRPRFVYQRSGLGDIVGLRLARHFERPLVLEYNGPEVWVAKNWSAGLPNADTFERIETELMRRADLVLAVSRPLVEDAISRGADPGRVMLSPNAVDPDRFHPRVSGDGARGQYALTGKKIALLLSTFGPWHGVNQAIEAFVRMLARRPDLRGAASLVLAGDGLGRKAAEQLASERGLRTGEDIVWTGAVAAAEAPSLLAAADVLLTPTLSNPDGSAFFGSPTKLFEYMAMGKAIVASDIAQLGEVLRNNETALLAPPGDIEALSNCIERCFDDPVLRARLGSHAREDALAHHTWTQRAQALETKLTELGAYRS